MHLRPIIHWKKWSHFDLKIWVTDRTKIIQPGIPSNWRTFEWNRLDIESQTIWLSISSQFQFFFQCIERERKTREGGALKRKMLGQVRVWNRASTDWQRASDTWRGYWYRVLFENRPPFYFCNYILNNAHKMYNFWFRINDTVYFFYCQ